MYRNRQKVKEKFKVKRIILYKVCNYEEHEENTSNRIRNTTGNVRITLHCGALPNGSCYGNITMHSVRIVELHVTVIHIYTYKG